MSNPATGKPLFFIFDTTHNIKNVFTNFQTKKIFQFYPSIGSEKIQADFNHINEFFLYELDKSLKIAHKLTNSIVAPSPIQKVSVKLANGIFNESTSNALKYYSESVNKDWSSTAAFLVWIKKL